MAWTYRIVDHGEHFVLHEVDLGEDGAVRDWVRRSIDFACDRDEGATGILSSLQVALAEARNAPIMAIQDDGTLLPIL
ncbi:hypothetical protein OLX02_11970 [Novosphingobium sp. KCTC 2891]|uniref:hypothetical protein n=1 Tax=Novosphingobium sp. KCTC 2891 TaxID=2989730 RepID=UPI002222F982|nr:hypothetical protein [Novosphingobium sp. KCTC 2891]MCW1383535.1 hypothetical protein [Novosphingobium sp. KCTC 2891]